MSAFSTSHSRHQELSTAKTMTSGSSNNIRHENVLHALSVGRLAGVFLLSVIAVPIAIYLLAALLIAESDETPLLDATVGLVMTASLLLLPVLAVRKLGFLRSGSMLAELRLTNAPWHMAVMAVPLVALSVFTVYVLYLPLSFLWPGFVSWYLLESVPTVWPRLDGTYGLASILNIFVLVLLAPVAEEVFFRGFLLRSLMRKYSTGIAITIVSLTFAIFHIDVIGAGVFSAILCLIFLRTGSLLGPVIVHIANNALAVVFILWSAIYYPDAPDTTLSEFYDQWWYAPIGALIGIPGLCLCWRLYGGAKAAPPKCAG